MTASQMLLIIGFVYLAPHMNRSAGPLIGLGFVMAACVVGLIGSLS